MKNPLFPLPSFSLAALLGFNQAGVTMQRSTFSDFQMAGIYTLQAGLTVNGSAFFPSPNALAEYPGQRTDLLDALNVAYLSGSITAIHSRGGYVVSGGNTYRGSNNYERTGPYDNDLPPGSPTPWAERGGWHVGTQLTTDGDLYQNLLRGLEVEVNQTGMATTVGSSQFANCGVGLFINSAEATPIPTTLYMHCNRFAPGAMHDGHQYGLVAGPGVSLFPIVGMVDEQSNNIPGTNWFPTEENIIRWQVPLSGVEADWLSPPGWVSIHSENATSYLRYENEFVGTRTGVSFPENEVIVVTAANTSVPPGAKLAECSISDEWPVVFPTRMAVTSWKNHQKSEASFQLFPNPSSKVLNVWCKQPDAWSRITIKDGLGRTIFISAICNTIQIETENLPEGLYWLVAKGLKGLQHVEKFIVQKDR